MAKIKYTAAEKRELVAVLGETKCGIYYPTCNSHGGFNSVYVTLAGSAVPSKMTIQALAKMNGHTPVYEGDTITIEF